MMVTCGMLKAKYIHFQKFLKSLKGCELKPGSVVLFLFMVDGMHNVYV